MGKVYFYALDLARISASQALLMGKVPTTKLDLARSGPFAPLRAPHPATPARRKRSGGRAVRSGQVMAETAVA